MNATQQFMDDTDWVERYAWFGAMEDMQGVNTVRVRPFTLCASSDRLLTVRLRRPGERFDDFARQHQLARRAVHRRRHP